MVFNLIGLFQIRINSTLRTINKLNKHTKNSSLFPGNTTEPPRLPECLSVAYRLRPPLHPPIWSWSKCTAEPLRVVCYAKWYAWIQPIRIDWPSTDFGYCKMVSFILELNEINFKYLNSTFRICRRCSGAVPASDSYQRNASTVLCRNVPHAKETRPNVSVAANYFKVNFCFKENKNLFIFDVGNLPAGGS